MRRSRGLLLIALAAALALASPAHAAGGRVTFPLASAVIASVDVFAPTVGVALPDNSVILAGVDRGRGALLVKVLPDGRVDARFGSGGISRLHLPHGAYIGAIPTQLLRGADGRMLLVYPGAAASKYESEHLLVAGITPGGALDRSYGVSGVADAGVQTGCGGGCTPAALLADGSLLLTGAVGSFSPAIERDPNAARDFTWVAAKLTSAGTLDATFGSGGIARIKQGDARGIDVAVALDGAIAALGYERTDRMLVRLTPAGTIEPAFNGGAPLIVAGGGSPGDIVARSGGGVDVALPASSVIRRYTASGERDASFGPNGELSLPGGVGSALIAAPDGSEISSSASGIRSGLTNVELAFTRIGADGSAGPKVRVPMRFGGGLASFFARMRPVQVPSLNQSSYIPGRPILRPDGALLVPGGVGVIQYTGEGEGFMHEEEAATLVGPDFRLVPSFGAGSRPPRIALRVPPQRAAAAASMRLLRVAVDATTSGPGLALLEVRAGRRLLARSTAPVLASGSQRLRALLTWTGRPYLRRARGVRVTVTARFRDLLGQDATASARGLLR